MKVQTKEIEQTHRMTIELTSFEAVQLVKALRRVVGLYNRVHEIDGVYQPQLDVLIDSLDKIREITD